MVAKSLSRLGSAQKVPVPGLGSNTSTIVDNLLASMGSSLHAREATPDASAAAKEGGTPEKLIKGPRISLTPKDRHLYDVQRQHAKIDRIYGR